MQLLLRHRLLLLRTQLRLLRVLLLLRATLLLRLRLLLRTLPLPLRTLLLRLQLRLRAQASKLSCRVRLRAKSCIGKSSRFPGQSGKTPRFIAVAFCFMAALFPAIFLAVLLENRPGSQRKNAAF